MESVRVKRFLGSEVGAAVLWVMGALLMAALASPALFRAGKGLAAWGASHDLPGLIEWLAASCGRAKFSRFFNRALLLSAIALLPFLLWRIRSLRSSHGLLAVARRPEGGWTVALAQAGAGCLLAATSAGLLSAALHASGIYEMRTILPDAPGLLRQVLLPALGASLVEEGLFRGLLLGLWLRFARPAAACAGSAAMFAFLHFLKPPAEMVIPDPAHPAAGFELLGAMLLHYTEPGFFIADFATLFAVGVLLAWARVRTGRLWLPIGLHAGWIIAFKSGSLIHQAGPAAARLPDLWLGESLRSGLLPLLTLGLTAFACHHLMRRWDQPGAK
jgi:uncharacterized protein